MRLTVGLDDINGVGEDLLGILSGDTGVDDDLSSGGPVGGRRDLVGVSELERVDDTDDLVKLTSGRGGVGEHETDGLLGVDHVD